MGNIIDLNSKHVKFLTKENFRIKLHSNKKWMVMWTKIDVIIHYIIITNSGIANICSKDFTNKLGITCWNILTMGQVIKLKSTFVIRLWHIVPLSTFLASWKRKSKFWHLFSSSKWIQFFRKVHAAERIRIATITWSKSWIWPQYFS